MSWGSHAMRGGCRSRGHRSLSTHWAATSRRADAADDGSILGLGNYHRALSHGSPPDARCRVVLPGTAGDGVPHGRRDLLPGKVRVPIIQLFGASPASSVVAVPLGTVTTCARMRRHIDGIEAVDHQRLPRAHVVANPQFATVPSHVMDDGIDQCAACVVVIADSLDIGHEVLAAAGVLAIAWQYRTT